MWTDKQLELLIAPGSHLLEVSGFRNAPVSILTGVMPPHEDYKGDWKTFSPGIRVYIYLFIAATSQRPNPEALKLLCQQDLTLFTRVWNTVSRIKNDFARDIVNLSFSRWSRILEESRLRPQKRQSSSWTREDITAEFFDETGEPRLGPPKRKTEPNLPRYDKPEAGPVRHISPEEYLATRSAKYGGVKPQFEKDSEHWAKEIPRSADKEDRYYDGIGVDQLIGMSE